MKGIYSIPDEELQRFVDTARLTEGARAERVEAAVGEKKPDRSRVDKTEEQTFKVKFSSSEKTRYAVIAKLLFSDFVGGIEKKTSEALDRAQNRAAAFLNREFTERVNNIKARLRAQGADWLLGGHAALLKRWDALNLAVTGVLALWAGFLVWQNVAFPGLGRLVGERVSVLLSSLADADYQHALSEVKARVTPLVNGLEEALLDQLSLLNGYIWTVMMGENPVGRPRQQLRTATDFVLFFLDTYKLALMGHVGLLAVAVATAVIEQTKREATSLAEGARAVAGLIPGVSLIEDDLTQAVHDFSSWWTVSVEARQVSVQGAMRRHRLTKEYFNEILLARFRSLTTLEGPLEEKVREGRVVGESNVVARQWARLTNKYDQDYDKMVTEGDRYILQTLQELQQSARLSGRRYYGGKSGYDEWFYNEADYLYRKVRGGDYEFSQVYAVVEAYRRLQDAEDRLRREEQIELMKAADSHAEVVKQYLRGPLFSRLVNANKALLALYRGRAEFVWVFTDEVRRFTGYYDNPGRPDPLSFFNIPYYFETAAIAEFGALSDSFESASFALIPKVPITEQRLERQNGQEGVVEGEEQTTTARTRQGATSINTDRIAVYDFRGGESAVAISRAHARDWQVRKEASAKALSDSWATRVELLEAIFLTGKLIRLDAHSKPS